MEPVRYATVCSGVECAGLAADDIGWEQLFLAENDPFACAVLQHRRPQIPNFGDMTHIADRIAAEGGPLPDTLIAGTPCQAFSIAGLRESLDSARGNLTLELVRVLDAIDTARFDAGYQSRCTLVWENVPGVLSTKDNAFGCLIAALVGADKAIAPFGRAGKWSRSGLVRGPRRAVAWRILDAQWFGVAQRRRRVFLVAGAGDGFDSAAVLFEPEGMCGHSAPSRNPGSCATAGTLGGTSPGGGWRLGSDEAAAGQLIAVSALTANGVGTCGADDNQAQAGHLIPFNIVDGAQKGKNHAYRTEVSGCLQTKGLAATGNEAGTLVAFGGNNTSGPIDVATARNAHGGPHGRLDFETETFLVTGGDVTHALNTANNGKHCSEDGTGRGVPTIAQAYRTSPNCGAWETGDRTDALTTGTDSSAIIARTYAGVRRLTPVECERLQGLPDNWTQIPVRLRKKLKSDYLAYTLKHRPDLTPELVAFLAADGPRYKAIGNGMAVPVVRWILDRLDRHLKGTL